VLDTYLERLGQTVDLLARYGIYTILDMHQDVYNQAFRGEGAPDWAVCTSGVAITDPPGRWSVEYSTPALRTAFTHFWRNNVVGDLQGQFDMVWGKVAAYFAGNPWVAGFDPLNEPFSAGVARRGTQYVDADLSCFYTGRAHSTVPVDGLPALRCPVDVPKKGIIPTLERADPEALIFFEPDIYGVKGTTTSLGPMSFPNLVYNFHTYCPQRSPVTGNPTDLAACVGHQRTSITHNATSRAQMTSPDQPRGPAWIVTEFGATTSGALLSQVTADLDTRSVGWIYWSWKYYDDPTGSAAEGLVTTGGTYQPTARVLSETYAQAVAGTPESSSFDPTTGRFHLRYRPSHRAGVPTVVFVATGQHYAKGWCASATGATVTLGASGVDLSDGVQHLLVWARPRADVVTVTVTAGACRTRS
jgi:endoglycosylceramidase